jgi:hypothetical protein
MTPADKAAADALIAAAPPLPPQVTGHLDTAIGPGVRDALREKAAAPGTAPAA